MTAHELIEALKLLPASQPLKVEAVEDLLIHEWGIPSSWKRATLVLVGERLKEADQPIALFEFARQAEEWAGQKGMYPGRYKLVTLVRP